MSGLFDTLRTEDRRLAIVRLLEEQPSANDGVLQSLLEMLGHAVSRDVVRSDLAWLDEQGLVSVEVVMGRVHVATITDRGVDVAKGRSVVPGVKRPSPRR
jgi:DeoR/GlpR family transcriptional regulator of sugar metabolism